MTLNTRRAAISFFVILIGTSGYMLLHGGGSHVDPPIEPPAQDRYDTTETDWNDYLWPTNAGTKRTSDFAEFRATHFHAGIDISTGGKTGFDVYASRAGWLHSAYFEPGGYGWFLVLRHPDGYYTCYAHLDRFSDRVRTQFRKRLGEMDRSYGFVRWNADTVRVKKGEVIAFTGETGAGPAHLHFEVRDASFNPVNPGLSPNLRPSDSIPPEMRQLCLTPLDASSAIDDAWDQQLYNVSGSGSSWRVKDRPVIRGRVGIMLRAHDRANGASDFPTPYKITLFVDGKEVLSTVNNRFNDSLGFHIRIDRDHALMRSKKGEFRKLFRENGNLLETYWPRDKDAGVLSAAQLGSGEKRLMIVAEDLSGNRSMLTTTVMIVDDAELTATVEGMNLSMAVRGTCEYLFLERRGEKSWDMVTQWSGTAANAGVQVDLKRFHGEQLRAVTEDAHGNRIVHASWAPGAPKRSAGRLYSRREIAYDEIVYDLKIAIPFSAPPSVSITQGDVSKEGRVFHIADNRYRAVFPTWEGFSGDAEVRVHYTVGAKEINWTDNVSGFHISAQSGGQVRSADGRFVLSFGPGDVFRSMLLTLDSNGGDTARAWTVGPADMPLAGRPVASVLAQGGSAKRMVIANWPVKNYGKEKLEHSPAIAGRFGRYLGTYRLLYDADGPEISAGFAYRSREPIRIHIRDSLSGVDWNSIAVYIDKALVPVEYNERRDLLIVPYEVYKELGKGMLTIRARDKLGNESVIKKNM